MSGRNDARKALFVSSAGEPISFYVLSSSLDTVDAFDVIRDISTHGGKLRKSIQEAEVVLINAAHPTGQAFLERYPPSSSRVVLKSTWLQQCINTGILLDQAKNWGGCLIPTGAVVPRPAPQPPPPLSPRGLQAGEDPFSGRRGSGSSATSSVRTPTGDSFGTRSMKSALSDIPMEDIRITIPEGPVPAPRSGSRPSYSVTESGLQSELAGHQPKRQRRNEPSPSTSPRTPRSQLGSTVYQSSASPQTPRSQYGSASYQSAPTPSEVTVTVYGYPPSSTAQSTTTTLKRGYQQRIASQQEGTLPPAPPPEHQLQFDPMRNDRSLQTVFDSKQPAQVRRRSSAASRQEQLLPPGYSAAQEEEEGADWIPQEWTPQEWAPDAKTGEKPQWYEQGYPLPLKAADMRRPSYMDPREPYYWNWTFDHPPPVPRPPHPRGGSSQRQCSTQQQYSDDEDWFIANHVNWLIFHDKGIKMMDIYKRLHELLPHHTDQALYLRVNKSKEYFAALGMCREGIMRRAQHRSAKAKAKPAKPKPKPKTDNHRSSTSSKSSSMTLSPRATRPPP